MGGKLVQLDWTSQLELSLAIVRVSVGVMGQAKNTNNAHAFKLLLCLASTLVTLSCFEFS